MLPLTVFDVFLEIRKLATNSGGFSCGIEHPEVAVSTFTNDALSVAPGADITQPKQADKTPLSSDSLVEASTGSLSSGEADSPPPLLML